MTCKRAGWLATAPGRLRGPPGAEDRQAAHLRGEELNAGGGAGGGVVQSSDQQPGTGEGPDGADGPDGQHLPRAGQGGVGGARPAGVRKRISILSGDYLLANTCVSLAALCITT